MAHSLQSLFKACKTDFLCTLNLLRMVYLNLQNVDFLLKGFCILRSVTRIMVKTYNCSCNRNMYFWWCSNVALQPNTAINSQNSTNCISLRLACNAEFIWKYFHCAFLGFCLGIFDSNVQSWGGEIWLHLTGMICPWAGNLTANFWKMLNAHPMPCLPPPPPPRRLYIDRCIKQMGLKTRL